MSTALVPLVFPVQDTTEEVAGQFSGGRSSWSGSSLWAWSPASLPAEPVSA